MNTNGFISELTERLLRCQNTAVLHQTDLTRLRALPPPIYAEALLKRAGAFAELNRKGELMSLRNQFVAEFTPPYSDVHYYAIARYKYFMGQYDEAHADLLSLAHSANDQRYRFCSWLVIANIGFLQDKVELTKESLIKAAEFKNMVPEADWCHFLLVEARTARKFDKNFAEAEQIYRSVLSRASKQAWTYFMNHAVFGLALVAKEQGKRTEAVLYVELLKSTIDREESPFLLHQINDEEFKESNISIGIPLEFNVDRLEIKVRNRIIPLTSRPLLFNFLHKLSTCQNAFTSKESIAECLWANESYNPAIHDSRIFDVVKRTRVLIEDFEEKPVMLLSGRMGYKLVRESPSQESLH